MVFANLKGIEMEKINFKNFNKIFVLVSGGIDSTFLYELFKKEHGDRVYPVNCYNPYETSKTLSQIALDPNYVQIKPEEKYNYGEILKDAFLQLPTARILKKQGKYHKKIFRCCYYIKHKSFLNDPRFKEPNTVVISGIKRGDGTQRRIWLTQLSKGQEPKNQSKGKPTFFHKHLGGQLFCYPFRDFGFRELPDVCINNLRKKYPHLDHSGCEMCPVLVLFKIKKEKRYKASYEYAHNLGVLENHLLNEWL